MEGGEKAAHPIRDAYATKYLKRERAVEDGEETGMGGEGGRPRRLRVPEGAYKHETVTRERREPEEGRERKIRKCAVVPVGSEALERLEVRQ